MKHIADVTTLSNGVKMPWVGLGVWKMTKEKEVERSVNTAIQAGYRSIDTAAGYDNEEGVGTGIRESGIKREEIFITTKVFNKNQGYESTLSAFETSRKKLGVDYVDLYLIHWPVLDYYQDTWRALEKLYREGYTRAIGVSNFQIPHLKELIRSFEIKPMVNQVECHPYHTQENIHLFCKQNEIQMEAWSPLMRGGDLLEDPIILNLSGKYNKTPAQIILRWHLERQIVIIPKSSTPERIEENANLFDFQLTIEECEKISYLNKNAQSFNYDPFNVRIQK